MSAGAMPDVIKNNNTELFSNALAHVIIIIINTAQ